MNEFWKYLIGYFVFGIIALAAMTIRLAYLNGKMKPAELITWELWAFLIWPFWAAFMLFDSARADRNNIKCAWCGETVAFKDKEAVQKHIAECKKHPLLNEIAHLQGTIHNQEVVLEAYRDCYGRVLSKREADKKFHPRAFKLIWKRKNFLVVAEDEPYFIGVYGMIRDHEKEIGRWNNEDEVKYQSANMAIVNRAMLQPQTEK